MVGFDSEAPGPTIERVGGGEVADGGATARTPQPVRTSIAKLRAIASESKDRAIATVYVALPGAG